MLGPSQRCLNCSADLEAEKEQRTRCLAPPRALQSKGRDRFKVSESHPTLRHVDRQCHLRRFCGLRRLLRRFRLPSRGRRRGHVLPLPRLQIWSPDDSGRLRGLQTIGLKRLRQPERITCCGQHAPRKIATSLLPTGRQQDPPGRHCGKLSVRASE